MNDLTQKTIIDFGDQWQRYKRNDGYYGSKEYFSDIVSPLKKPQDYQNKTVLDIGSGSGRIVRMLVEAGAEHVYAVEPSQAAFKTLQENTADIRDKITYLNVRGDQLPSGLEVDEAVSIGVIHHIPDPDPTIAAMFHALKPGGHCLVWLYGYEGSEVYLKFALPLRRLTVHLPHFLLAGICHLLTFSLGLYVQLCRIFPMPLKDYALNVLRPLPYDKRYLIIYDQLNPAYAKYYKQDESKALLARQGFQNVIAWHRHGYSWTVLGKK